jgi:hypothetical protein
MELLTKILKIEHESPWEHSCLLTKGPKRGHGTLGTGLPYGTYIKNPEDRTWESLGTCLPYGTSNKDPKDRTWESLGTFLPFGTFLTKILRENPGNMLALWNSQQKFLRENMRTLGTCLPYGISNKSLTNLTTIVHTELGKVIGTK